jgi:hypothetical protein
MANHLEQLVGEWLEHRALHRYDVAEAAVGDGVVLRVDVADGVVRLP